jgi:Arc/MetJ-type ribon-helix-helix transcriptional regulator
MAITVTLEGEDEALVSRLVDAGRYRSAAETVAAGVRLAEQAAARASFDLVIENARAQASAGDVVDAEQAFDHLRWKYALEAQ